jgi:hypothetical protein
VSQLQDVLQSSAKPEIGLGCTASGTAAITGAVAQLLEMSIDGSAASIRWHHRV